MKQVVIGNGSSQVLHSICLTLSSLNNRDLTIYTPRPYYKGSFNLLKKHPQYRFVNNFYLNPDIGLISSPNNPTGEQMRIRSQCK